MSASALQTPFAVKDTDTRRRRFRGLASTWGPEPDYGGDVVIRGAFRDTVAAWRRSGATLPLVDSHDYGSILRVLGKMTDAQETAAGLETEWEVVDTPSGDEALARIRGGYVTGMSIGYVPIRARSGRELSADEGQRGVRRALDAVTLLEVSLVQYPMNPAALIHASERAKAAAARAAAAASGMAMMDPEEQERLQRQIAEFLERHRMADKERGEQFRKRLEGLVTAQRIRDEEAARANQIREIQLRSLLRSVCDRDAA